MTSLIIYTTDTEAVVAMDTYGTDMEGRPFLYTTKAHYLPHLRTIIAGTGCGGFACDWFVQVNKRMVVRDVEVLNSLAPAMLCELWERFREDYQLPEDKTTTVFHIGYSEATGHIVRTQFHSGHEFRAEEIPSGLTYKPPCKEPEELAQEGAVIFDLIRPIMEQQRREAAERPREDRVNIGGQAMVLHLQPGGCAHFPLFEFDEYQEQRKVVLARAQLGF